MGLIARQAAYEFGDGWLTELQQYLFHNLNYIREFLKEHIPDVKLVEPEGTYLVWIDFSNLKLTEEELEILIVKKAKLWLDAGTIFGPEGLGFQRINIACPRETLAQALGQLKDAVSELKNTQV